MLTVAELFAVSRWYISEWIRPLASTSCPCVFMRPLPCGMDLTTSPGDAMEIFVPPACEAIMDPALFRHVNPLSSE